MRNIITTFVAALLVSTTLLVGCSKKAEPAQDKPVAAQPASVAVSIDPDRPYCGGHKAYEDECFLCHEELREEGRLWCSEHTRYEDRCFLCHPDQQNKKRPYCTDHYLYLDECHICHPELRQKSAVTKEAAAQKGLMCKEHGIEEAECGICHSDLAAKLEPGMGLKVRFPSLEAASKAGVITAKPRVGPISEDVDCYAEIVFNQNKLAKITAPVAGVIQTVEVDVGGKVEAEARLGSLWSAEIGEDIAKVVLARQALDRERKLRAERISSEKELQEAEASYQTAYQKVRTIGFEDADIAALATNTAEAAVVRLRAPFAGEIVERSAVQGAKVEAGVALFTVVDRSTMWAMLNIPEKQLSKVRVGQSVELKFDSSDGFKTTGRLTWIAAQVDDRSRMAKARAEIEDPEGTLRANMFARARISISESKAAVIVPQSAVQSIDNRDFVFVKLADDLFEARAVRLGPKRDGNVQVAEGLTADEQVVVSGGFIAKSQFLISKLGAGCVD